MDEVVLSKRAQLIWSTFAEASVDKEYRELPIRQQTLAELFGCSRRTIGRCLVELKAAGLLVDAGKRENRIKVYTINRHGEEALADVAIHESMDGFSAKAVRNDEFEYISFPSHNRIQPPPLRVLSGETLNPHAADYWQLYYPTIRSNLWMFDGKNGRPCLEDVYVSLTQQVTGKNIDEIWRNLFDALYGAPYYWPCRLSHSQEQGSNMFEWLEADEVAIAQKAIEKWRQML